MTVHAGAVTEAFTQRTGRSPDGVWAAPGRVNLIGEHTDYNDGFVLPVAIDRHVVVAAGRRADGRLRCFSTHEDVVSDRPLDDVGPGRSSGWAAYVEGVAWALREKGLSLPGADLVVDSDLPVGAGLSSSAALEGAVALALRDLSGSTLAPVELALAGQRAESEVVGMPCGIMDQMAVMTGRAGHALFLDTRSLATELVPFDLRTAGLELVVIDTRVSHRLTDAPYAERRRACHEAARVLGVGALRDASLADLEAAAADLGDTVFRRARHVVTENARVLETVDRLRAGATKSIGPLLAASHASLRDDFEVSCPELDLAVETALTSGAVAARMTGAGFGGSALALVPPERLPAMTAAVVNAFGTRGFGDPAVVAVLTADAAERVA